MKPCVTKSLCNEDQLTGFLHDLKNADLVLERDDDDNVELKLHGVVIADFIEPRIVHVQHPQRGIGFVECSLDYGNGLEFEPDFDAEIPKMKLRIYKVKLEDGQIRRDSPDYGSDAEMIDDMIDRDFNDDEPSDGETIVHFNELQYKVIQV
jgi:hypothetical protein